MTIALLLVPGQYDNKDMFLDVAKDLKSNFCTNSVIFQITWDGKPENSPDYSAVGGVPAGFSKDFWSSVAAADTFICLSHSGIRDGPMLGPQGEQPWPTVEEKGKELTQEARLFWSRISWGLGGEGRILIAGCDTAHSYGKLVAKLMTVAVYGFKEHIGAGVKSEMRKYIGGQFLKGREGRNVTRC